MSKTSDNVNLDFPARMADGRIFTDYRPNCVMNNLLSKEMNSFEYRYYLMHNGNQLEKNNMEQLEKDVKCTGCEAQTLLPVKTIQNCNAGVCQVSLNDPNGLGMGRANTSQ